MASTIESSGDAGQRERQLTVARVRTTTDHAEVMFFESARIYRLPYADPAYGDALRQLRAAAATGKPVCVRFLQAHGDVIESIRTGG
ncbi:MAG TPA: hypothetical protein P5186_13970 [Candidatus Paceibacterota bacterium]|nr:hypothetical protein [Verrucomicrobiota bacterium]HRY49151.1 hypothetical protein [Candidatus Paceibacterota bacterium]HSA00906.1 hypothetical protein [Candidatus Paceibacterota bacterium]